MSEIKRDFLWILVRIGLIAGMGWLLFSFVFLVTRAEDNGMFPSVKAGDLLIGFRMQKDYVKDDVVIYRRNGRNHVGRIMGKAGDVITINQDGTLILNGTVQTGEILFPTYPKKGQEYPYTIPEDSVYILGDHRTETEDSRDFGSISLEDVKAKVITVFRRRDL